MDTHSSPATHAALPARTGHPPSRDAAAAHNSRLVCTPHRTRTARTPPTFRVWAALTLGFALTALVARPAFADTEEGGARPVTFTDAFGLKFDRPVVLAQIPGAPDQQFLVV